MTTNPINIEFKEDSAEKLAKIAGQPTKYYIKAPEFNEVVNRLKTLWNLVQVNSTNIDSLILGENILDFTTASFIDEINAGPIITLSSAYFRVTVDGVVSIYAFTGVDGNYGSGALQVTEEQCLLLYTSTDTQVPQSKVLKLKITEGSASVTFSEQQNNTGLTIDCYYDEPGAIIVRFQNGGNDIETGWDEDKINLQTTRSKLGQVSGEYRAQTGYTDILIRTNADVIGNVIYLNFEILP